MEAFTIKVNSEIGGVPLRLDPFLGVCFWALEAPVPPETVATGK
jgi:hypothetical protein